MTWGFEVTNEIEAIFVVDKYSYDEALSAAITYARALGHGDEVTIRLRRVST